MRTKSIIQTVLQSALGIAVIAGLIYGCSDYGYSDYGDYTDYLNEGYTNPNDQTTTDVNVSIPRIEITGNKGKVYISVTDQDGKPLNQFNQHNFVVKQVCKGSTDTIDITASSFSSLDKQGKYIAAAATLDYSGSMSPNDITQMESALVEFINTMDASDYLEVIKFSDVSTVVQTFTNDKQLLTNAVNSDYADGYTAFYDAMYQGLNDCQSFYASRTGYLAAVLAFTDGVENNSSVSLPTILDLAKQNQIPIYTIGYGSTDETIMTQIATETGGRYLYAPDAAMLKELYTTISGQLKNIYEYSWNFTNTTCQEVLIIVETTYTGAKGTFKETTVKSYFPK